MSLFRSLLQGFQTWRQRRGGPKKTERRAGVAVERLDHRQLLTASMSPSLAFTGNVTTDFPTALLNKGVVELSAVNPNQPGGDQIAAVADPGLKALIGSTPDGFSNSGFAFQKYRVSYDPRNDTLNIGLITANPQTIGSDVDASNNSAFLSASVNQYIIDHPALEDFKEWPDVELGESIFSFLDLNGDGVSDIVAGYPQDPSLTPNIPAKLYQVALANNPNNNPGVIPLPFPWPNQLDPKFLGNVYTVNDTNHPNIEYSIKHFSELYSTFNNGAPLTPASTISVGLFANSIGNPSFSPTIISLKEVPIDDATLPDLCPAEPPVLINPHENAHVNTAHPTDVKVVVFGSARFDTSAINPDTVRLGGAVPYAALPLRMINHDPYPDRVFLFNGSEINLPPGITDAVVTGELADHHEFESTVRIFNRTSAYYTPQAQAEAAARQAAAGPLQGLTPIQIHLLHANATDQVIDQAVTANLATKRSGVAAGLTAQKAPMVPPGARAAHLPRVRAPQSADTTGTGPVVKIPMARGAARQIKVDISPGNVVSIPNAGGQGKLQPRKLKIDTSAARASMAR